MKFKNLLVAAFMVFNLSSCTSAKEKKDEASAAYTEEKTQTLQQYKKCVADSNGEESKMAQCDALLKAVGAVEGGTVEDNAAPVPAVAPAVAPVAAPAPTPTAAPAPVAPAQ